ncbi:MAG: DinB family protein [Chloroflexia bacterium]|nr:DinB family protein [Chloroflexia bacterium]
MTPFGRAYEYQLRNVVNDLLTTLGGIPDDQFNTWKPAAAREGGHEMNTFAALSIHAVSAGEFMTLHAVGGQPSQRDREAEFEATGSPAEIVARYERWLDGVHALMEDFSDADLDRASFSDRYTERNWRAAEILLHALDHTALHAGHLQLQRQLWEAERP